MMGDFLSREHGGANMDTFTLLEDEVYGLFSISI